jgi:hypothetical protein
MTALKRSVAVVFVLALLIVPATSSAATPPKITIPSISSLTSLLPKNIGSGSLGSIETKLSSLSISKSQVTSLISSYLKYLPASVQAQINALLAKLPSTISLGSLTGLLPKGVSIPGLG